MFWRRKKTFSHLIAGLGNPGKDYENSLHNTGFRVVEKIAGRLGENKVRKRGSYLFSEPVLHGKKIVIIQPLTYMNQSGTAVADALRWYRLSPDMLTVIYDDMDLAPGVIRLRPRGGSGGHRGIGSIVECLGTDCFSRLRVGIGRPPRGLDPKDYVLGSSGEWKDTDLDKTEERAADAIMVMLSEGIEAAMNQFNILQ